MHDISLFCFIKHWILSKKNSSLQKIDDTTWCRRRCRRRCCCCQAKYDMNVNEPHAPQQLQYFDLCPQHTTIYWGSVEPQITHFANFTPCEELVPKRHFWKMWILRMVNFDNFWGLTSVLRFHIFLIFNCEELVRFRIICEGLSPVENQKDLELDFRVFFFADSFCLGIVLDESNWCHSGIIERFEILKMASKMAVS